MSEPAPKKSQRHLQRNTEKKPSAALLIDERPLVVLPGLAKLLGLNEAIVLQQVHFLLTIPNAGREINGNRWIWNTLQQWHHDHFPFFSMMTLRRAICSLEAAGALLHCQPDGRISRKKYYRVNHHQLAILQAKSRSVQNEHFDVFKVSSSVTETSPDINVSKPTRIVDNSPEKLPGEPIHPAHCNCLDCRKTNA